MNDIFDPRSTYLLVKCHPADLKALREAVALSDLGTADLPIHHPSANSSRPIKDRLRSGDYEDLYLQLAQTFKEVL